MSASHFKDRKEESGLLDANIDDLSGLERRIQK
jgi:hypothetical protein